MMDFHMSLADWKALKTCGKNTRLIPTLTSRIPTLYTRLKLSLRGRANVTDALRMSGLNGIRCMSTRSERRGRYGSLKPRRLCEHFE